MDDLLYSIRPLLENRDSNCDVSASADIKATSKVCSERLGPGAYEDILNSGLLIGLGYSVPFKQASKLMCIRGPVSLVLFLIQNIRKENTDI